MSRLFASAASALGGFDTQAMQAGAFRGLWSWLGKADTPIACRIGNAEQVNYAENCG